VPDQRRCTLTVNGTAYGGWKSINIGRSIQQVAGTFSLAVSDRFPLQQISWPIREGDECTVEADGEVVITGNVDKRSPEFDAKAHTLSVEGRDKTGDLVDCSVFLPTWELVGLKADAIVKKLCTPLGVKVSIGAGVTIPAARAKFALNPGEKAFDAIDRICRLSGLLPISDGRGGLILSQTGVTRCATALVQGQNILSARGTYDATGRYARYVVRGSNTGSDDDFGESVAAVSAEAKDDGARAVRILYIRPEGTVTLAQAKERAQWEAATRAARSGVVSVTVQGWRQSAGGALWPINALVHLESSFVGIDADMIISDATFGLDDSGGTVTTMNLVRPDAFKPKPVVTKQTDTWDDEP